MDNMYWVLGVILLLPASYSQQEAKEKEEAESRTRAKREAEKVVILED